MARKYPLEIAINLNIKVIVMSDYNFAGGYIKNAVLSSLRHMLSRNGDVLLMEDLVFGAEGELKGFLKSQTKGPMGFLAPV